MLSLRLVCCVALMLFAGALFAHGGAAGIVKDRMDSMSAMGKAMKRLNVLTKGTADDSPREVRDLSAVISRHAKKIPAYFPDSKKSRQGKGTLALPAIWENLADFEARAKELADQSRRLAETAAGSERQATRKLFKQIGKSCSGCHRAYRKKQKKH